MLESEDLYEILQVHPSAHPAVIHAAHRQLAELYGPGRNPFPNASDMLDAINHAYEVLIDPAHRAAYDQYRKTRSQVPDVVRAKSFQVLDDSGNIRAELGSRVVKHRDSSDTEPILELKDSVGNVRFSVSLDYFDQPRLVMADEDEDDERFVVAVDSDGETQLLIRDEGDSEPLELSGRSLVVRDRDGTVRLQSGLDGGDEGDSPRLAMRDRAGRTRLEVELVEVELDGGREYVPLLRVRDEDENVVFEQDLSIS